MRTPANIAKHPIHPMLVAIPIGLWLVSLICDLVFYFGGASRARSSPPYQAFAALGLKRRA